jgi:hypothetical protein
MEGMSEPGPVEKISNSPAGRAPSLVRRNDGALKPVGERFQPILALEALDGSFPKSLKVRLWCRHTTPPGPMVSNRDADGAP